VSERQAAIVEIARQTGRVTVDQLAQRFSVSPQTIRKDLNELCDRKSLARVHGGAVLSFGLENVGYDARREIAREEKLAIGRLAAALIPSHASLFINIGTTTEAVAVALLQHQDLLVITNNINVASMIRPYPKLEVIIAGGLVRRSDGGVVGEATVDFINQFKLDYAVIGASAIDAEGSLLDYDFREVRVAQAIIANARHTILVADSTKFSRSAPVRIGHISQVQSFVTDRIESGPFRQLCEEAGVALIESEASSIDRL
jgi:DeoR family transcriptional regulator, glycerol-3-phosphate regulon repressor